MSEQNNKVTFMTDDQEVEFTVIEQTKMYGYNYLLVTDSLIEDEDEAQAYILKEVSTQGDTEAVYDIVDDEKELEVIGKIFSELIDDFDIK